MCPTKRQITCAVLAIFIAFSKAENRLNSTSSSNNSAKLTEIQCHTNICLHNTTFTWNIDNLDFHRPSNVPRYSIVSPTFSPSTNDKIKWYMKLYPGDKNSKEISLFLYYSSYGMVSSVLAKFSISFLDSQRNLLKKYNADLREFSFADDNFGWYHLHNNDVISPDNTLNIVCDIVICKCTNNVSHLNRTSTDTSTTSTPSYNRRQNFIPSTKHHFTLFGWI